MSRSISNRCERNTATPMDSGRSMKDNAKPTLRNSSVRGVSPPTNERSTGSWKGSRDTQGRAEQDPPGLPTLRLRGEPAVTIDKGPGNAHHDPQEHQVRNSLQGGPTRVQPRKENPGQIESDERDGEPARPARCKSSPGKEEEEQHAADIPQDFHAP